MNVPSPQIFIGWDPHESMAYEVAVASLRRTSPAHICIPLDLTDLRRQGLYTRPTQVVDGHLFDVYSQAPMSTEHAISRFFLPFLCQHEGWALFVDGDVLFRADVRDLFALAEDRYAVMCVQHLPLHNEGVKKDGVPQLAYPRKNWSSVMLFNCAHPAHTQLTLNTLNTWPGRDLHAFRWLDDDVIGALPARWNYLVGVTPRIPDAAIVHFTLGTPNLPDHARDSFADEWYAMARQAGCSADVDRKVGV